MKIQLSPSWVLTTDHSASSYNQPVLVNRADGEAYGPGDLIQAYDSWEILPASAVVLRLAEAREWDEDEKEFVWSFLRDSATEPT